MYPLPLSPQLSHERQNAQLKEEEKDQIRKTMHGFVSQEKEKFERLAKHMKYQQKDLQAKSAQIEQVKELIRNSPRVGSSGGRAPLRDTQVSAEGHVSASLVPRPSRLCTSAHHQALCVCQCSLHVLCVGWDTWRRCSGGEEEHSSSEGQKSQEILIRELVGTRPQQYSGER